MVIRVLIAARQSLVRTGLKAVLGSEDGLEVVGLAAGPAELVALAASRRPDVALVADDLGEEEAGALWGLGAEGAPAVLVLGQDEEPAAALAALRAGARGYLAADSSDREIAAATRAAASGLTVLGPAVAQALAAQVPEPRPRDPLAVQEALTPREREVLQLIAQGLPNKTIAQRLRISDHTVKFHVGAIMAKLGAASRTEAVTVAARRGILVL